MEYKVKRYKENREGFISKILQHTFLDHKKYLLIQKEGGSWSQELHGRLCERCSSFKQDYMLSKSRDQGANRGSWTLKIYLLDFQMQKKVWKMG
jgi:hypothetical protein